MKPIPAIAIFDIGKTNKKLLLFDEQYKLIYEEGRQLNEITDEDSFPCEDVHALTQWIEESFDVIAKDKRFEVKAVNFSAYGASFVYLDESLHVFLPLYNYLKPFPGELKERFYNTYGDENSFAKTTASPVLGNLNSGMQLYRIKYEKPAAFSKIKHALHLPQFASFVLTGKLYSDITSIGCHTNLWNFQTSGYHDWLPKENIEDKLPPIATSDHLDSCINKTILPGIGLHDSSAALIPYLISFTEPFVLLSTGTWCITLNPFNSEPLTDEELRQDCLCYLSYLGKPVKASRLFAGYEHEQQTKRLAEHFNKPDNYYKTISFNSELLTSTESMKASSKKLKDEQGKHAFFESGNLNAFNSYEAAYHHLMASIVARQFHSTNLVVSGTVVKRIFVDGGFSSNSVYMNLLAEAFPGLEVYAAAMPQASALGAALVIHAHWNSNPLPTNIISLRLYSPRLKDKKLST